MAGIINRLKFFFIEKILKQQKPSQRIIFSEKYENDIRKFLNIENVPPLYEILPPKQYIKFEQIFKEIVELKNEIQWEFDYESGLESKVKEAYLKMDSFKKTLSRVYARIVQGEINVTGLKNIIEKWRSFLEEYTRQIELIHKRKQIDQSFFVNLCKHIEKRKKRYKDIDLSEYDEKKIIDLYFAKFEIDLIEFENKKMKRNIPKRMKRLIAWLK